MNQRLQEIINSKEEALGRKLSPNEFQDAKHQAELKSLEDDDDYFDPMELLEQQHVVVEPARPSVGRRIRVPEAAEASPPKKTVPIVAQTEVAAAPVTSSLALSNTAATLSIPRATGAPVTKQDVHAALAVAPLDEAPSQTVAESPEFNPIDDRLGNLSGTPRATSFKKNWERRSNATYRRSKITDNDLRAMAFIAKFKFTNSRQVAAVLEVKENTAHRRLLGLQEVGLTASEEVLGARQLWRVTGKGLSLLIADDQLEESDVTLVRSGDTETSQLGHYLAVNQIAVQLIGGHYDWLGLDQFAGSGPSWMDEILTEYQVKSAWEAWKRTVATGSESVDFYHRKVWESKPSKVLHPECWTLGREYGDKLANQYHHPDLVFLPPDDREHGIAFEAEISKKSVSEYMKSLSNFRTNSAGYRNVVWVCGSKVIAERVQQAAESVGLPDGFMKLVPLRSLDGAIFTDKAWRL